MRLLKVGTLRCRLVPHAGKFLGKCLANAYPTTFGWYGCVAEQRRQYADVPFIDLTHEHFDSPTPNASRSPLITMHGLFGSKQNWRSVSKVLAKQTNRRVYTVDLRNHGDSPHTTEHNSRGMTSDLVAFAQKNSVTETCLMGHSMGGRAAMHFALHNPKMTERLIVVDISPVNMPNTLNSLRGILLAMQAITPTADISLSKGRQVAKEALLKTIESETVDFILLNLRKRQGSGEFYWACNVDVLIKSLPSFVNYDQEIERLPPFTGPTTFICGTHSPYMNPNDWPQVLKYFPNASLHWLEAGHLVHLEQPHKFIEIVTEFLNKP